MPGPGEIRRWLEQMREGDPEAAEELLSHVYRELRTLAAGNMAHEAPGQPCHQHERLQEPATQARL